MHESPVQVIPAIYASTSGNTEWVVEQVAGVWQAAGQTVQLHRAEQTDPTIWQQHETFLLATSTWDHGTINPFFNKLLAALKETNCAGKRAAFIGTGDVRYEPVLFCGGMETLKNTWVERGGQAIGVPMKFNGEVYAKFESVIQPWAEKILQELQLAPISVTQAPANHNIFSPTVVQQALVGAAQ